jgi:hypothetical protein
MGVLCGQDEPDFVHHAAWSMPVNRAQISFEGGTKGNENGLQVAHS